MTTHLVIRSHFTQLSLPVASWEEAVQIVDTTIAELEAANLDTTIEATIFEPENRSWQRIIDEDGNFIWQED